MPSDSSNAHDALSDEADKKESDGGRPSDTGKSPRAGLESGKTPQARATSDDAPSLDTGSLDEAEPASIDAARADADDHARSNEHPVDGRLAEMGSGEQRSDSRRDPDDEGRALLSDLAVGSIVDGKYRIDEVLGRGAMGVVFAATHLHLGERVALKFLRAKAGMSDDFRSRFKREARVSAKLKNEHITRVIDVGVWKDNFPYMVMDYLDGIDLRKVMRAAGAMPLIQAVEYTVQVCEGIAEAHANGVVHRDLKPSNLFVTKRPDGTDLVKVLDFGISKWSMGVDSVDELTQTGVVLGSPKYMAPEQLFGTSEVDARADVWSIGAILYEMLSARPPFDMASFTKICAELSTDRPPPSAAVVANRTDISPELEAVLMRCFQRTPALRVQNVAELAGDLLKAVGAPFAEQVRAKIAATLEPRAPRDPLGASGSMSFQTGSYPPLLSQSGSSGQVVRISGSGESTGASLSSSAGAMAQDRRKKGIWLVLGAAVLAGAGIYLFAAAGRDNPRPTEGTVVTPPPPTATMTAAPVVTATAVPVVTATAATAAVTAAATDTVSAPPATASATARPIVHGPWRPPPRHEPAATANAAAPTATTTPVPTTAPTPTVKSNPLDDRQ